MLLVWVLSNGLLLLAILSAGDPSHTFTSGGAPNPTKIYMTFILAFVAITSITVSIVLDAMKADFRNISFSSALHVRQCIT